MKSVVLYHRHTIVNQSSPGCLHAAFALAFVALILMAGYIATSAGLSAYAVNVTMLVSTVYALGYVVVIETKNWIDGQFVRSYA